MSENFLHGIEVIEIDTGPRAIRTASSSVIGLIGTAPEADEAAFPLDTPVLIAGSRLEAARLGTSGTLPDAVDDIFDQIGAAIVVIRVAESGRNEDGYDSLSAVIGGVDPATGRYRGAHAFLAAKNLVKVKPKILIAPGFTHQRLPNRQDPVPAEQTMAFPDNDDTRTLALMGRNIAELTLSDERGATPYAPGTDYELDAATGVITRLDGGALRAGSRVKAVYTHIPAAPRPLSNPVLAELAGIAERLHAVVVADGPNTTDAEAIDCREDWGSPRIYLVDPWIRKLRNGVIRSSPASAGVAGLIAKIDNDLGFWWSPSNNVINGILGTHRAVDFELDDPACRANYLNSHEVATIIQENGYRLWGNRTCSNDAKWAFLSVRRTADMLNESVLQAHLWAVDRAITKTYVDDVTEGVNAYMRRLKAQGAILGGRCWPDPDLNVADAIKSGRIYFNFDFTPPYPAERITFRSHLVDDYIEEIFK